MVSTIGQPKTKGLNMRVHSERSNGVCRYQGSVDTDCFDYNTNRYHHGFVFTRGLSLANIAK